MKSNLLYLVLLFALLFEGNTLYGQFQKSRLSATVISVSKEGLDEKSRPSLKEYPYLTATFYFQNRTKFEDKSFIKKILNVKYLYVESSFSYTTINKEIIDIKAPLFIIERNRGTYSSSILEDFTLVNKIPYNIYGSSIPSVTCYTKRVSKNRLSIIGELTSLYKPYIGINPIGSLTDITGFVDDVVKKFAQKQTLEVKASFPAFSVRDLEIQPFSHKVLLYHSTKDAVDSDSLILKDVGNKMLLHKIDSGKAKPVVNPYIVIEVGLSNYLALGGLPSETLDATTICGVNEEEIDDYESFLEDNQSLLSRNQLRNEYYILRLLKQNLRINQGVDAERQNSTDQIIRAYDSYYDFKYQKNEKSGILYDAHYKGIAEAIISCIDNSRLAYINSYNIIIEQLSKGQWEYDAFGRAKNAKLLLESDASKNMSRTKLFKNIEDRLKFYESSLYNSSFKALIQDLNSSLTDESGLTDEIDRKFEELKIQIQRFPDCDMCNTKYLEVQSKYIPKIRNQNLRNLIDYKDRLESDGFRVLDRMANYMKILEGRIDSESENPTVSKADLSLKKNEIENQGNVLKAVLQRVLSIKPTNNITDVMIQSYSVVLNELALELSRAKALIEQTG